MEGDKVMDGMLRSNAGDSILRDVCKFLFDNTHTRCHTPAIHMAAGVLGNDGTVCYMVDGDSAVSYGYPIRFATALLIPIPGLDVHIFCIS